MLVNWKTTVLGFAVGFLNLWAQGISPKQIAISAGFAALGAVARDFNKSSEQSGAK